MHVSVVTHCGCGLYVGLMWKALTGKLLAPSTSYLEKKSRCRYLTSPEKRKWLIIGTRDTRRSTILLEILVRWLTLKSMTSTARKIPPPPSYSHWGIGMSCVVLVLFLTSALTAGVSANNHAQRLCSCAAVRLRYNRTTKKAREQEGDEQASSSDVRRETTCCQVSRWSPSEKGASRLICHIVVQ